MKNYQISNRLYDFPEISSLKGYGKVFNEKH
jgi:hypothetical protein